MNKTLREKLQDHNDSEGYVFLEEEQIIADCVDALSARLDGAIADVAVRLNALESTITGIQKREARDASELNELHESVNILAEQVGNLDDLPDPTTPSDHDAAKGTEVRGKADRPWCEAAEACAHELIDDCLVTPDEDPWFERVQTIIESAIEKAVEQMKGHASFWHRSYCSIRAKHDKLYDERNALKTEVKRLEAQRESITGRLYRALYPKDDGERGCWGIHIDEVEQLRCTNASLHDTSKELKSEVERLQDKIANHDIAILQRFDARAAKSTDLETWIRCMLAEKRRLRADVARLEASDQSRVDELHRALYPNGGELDWNTHIAEVRRLKADKPHVVHLTREELEEALHTTGWATSSACMQKTVDRILALQDKHAEKASHAQD